MAFAKSSDYTGFRFFLDSFFLRTPVSLNNTTDCHDIVGILLEVELNTITVIGENM
jgi:hypothetical protein